MTDSEYQPGEFDWRTETITQRSLLAKELEPLNYLVKDIIVTPGLVVLAAVKKSGKSWMALQLAQCVASGTPFLGKRTKQGKVIYLALEDGEYRLRYRLDKQSANPKLPIRYCPSWPPLNETEGFTALGDILRVTTPVLVIIDTLASAINKDVKENEAESIGTLFNRLHDLAIGANTVILIVAHHGKKSYGDVGFDIRGSSAIPGATDTNIGLYKNTDGTFTLKAEGRDILEVEFRIKFDSEATWSWQYLGDDRDIRRVEAENRILDVIANLGECYASDIAKELGIARPTIYQHLKRMRSEGRVTFTTIKTASGVKVRYRIPQESEATSPTWLLPSPGLPGRRVGDVGGISEDMRTGELARKFTDIFSHITEGDVTQEVIDFFKEHPI